MKRTFIYLIALLLFPQVVSAVILAHKPVRTFPVQQAVAVTYVTPAKVQKRTSHFAPHVFISYNCCRQNVELGKNIPHVRLGNTYMHSKKYYRQKPLPCNLSIRADYSSHRKLCQAR
jgi:hypothetical protein